MRVPMTVRSVTLLAVLLTLPACFSLSRDAPPLRHYVLGAAQPRTSAGVGGDSGAPTIGVRPVRLAEYLATPFIIVRSDGHRVAYSEFHRWGEDLGRAIHREVAARLGERMPSRRIEAAPFSPGTPPEYLLQLELLRFEGIEPDPTQGLDGAAYLVANWEILRRESGAILARGATEVRTAPWEAGDFGGLVRLLDAGLDALVEDLEAALVRVIPPLD
jgi:uncharacterized protein